MSDVPTPPAEPQKPLTLDPGKKYIRTFAGDMEVAKQGGTPELAPYASPTVPHNPVAVAPVEQVASTASASASVPASVHVAPTYDDTKRAEVLARLRAVKQAEASKPLAARSINRLNDVVPDATATAAPLHTYAEDFTDRVATEGASPLTVLAAEQDAQPLREESYAPSSSKNYLIAGAALVLVMVGGGVGYYTYLQYQRANAPVPAAPRIYAPIFVDEQVAIEGEGRALLDAVVREVGRPVTLGSVRLLYSQSATTTRESIFIAAQLPVPSVVARNVRGAESVAGVVSVNGTQSPFFILSVSSYNDTFAGMLSWERTILNDLAVLYPPRAAADMTLPSLSGSGTVSTSTATSTTGGKSTTTPATPAPARAPVVRIPGFYDEVIANHDARVYHDMRGDTTLVYGYWSPSVLVIARDADAYMLILGRLANSRVGE